MITTRLSEPVQITFTKAIDIATPPIMQYALEGKAFIGDFYKQKKVDGQYVVLEHLHFLGWITADEETVQAGAGIAQSVEKVSISAAEGTWTTRQILPDGSVTKPVAVNWTVK